MPTGYTGSIYNGEEVSAEQFIKSCARNFGALISMRDDPAGSEIPIFGYNDYHLRATSKAQEMLIEHRKMSREDAANKLKQEYDNELVRYNERLEESFALEEKYTRLLKEVESWKSPSREHDGLKEFAINQLVISISSDCERSYIKPPEEVDVDEYLKAEEIRILRDIEYHEKGWKEEVERIDGRNNWVKLLKESFDKDKR